MMNKMRTLQQLQDNYLVAVVRGNTEDDAWQKCKQIIEGGILNIEVTFTTPHAETVIKSLSTKYKTDVLIGAGTVMDATTARIAIMNGAKFIVSPHFDAQIAMMCNLYTIPYLPGCSSVTEITTALQHGVDVVKLFPGDGLGADFIKNIHGPLPQVEMMPSGGVSIENMHEWYEKGAFAIGIGSALTKGAQDGSDRIIVKQTRAFVERFKNIKA